MIVNKNFSIKNQFKKNKIHKNNSTDNIYNIIENVPFINQETSFYCHFACLTMILKYYGINVTLDEILYNSGIGYSLMYPNPKNKYFPVAGYTISQSLIDCKFIANLYGFIYEYWSANIINSDDQCWQQFLYNVKQNIQYDIPVKITVNSYYLNSLKNKSKYVFKSRINKLYRWVFKFISSTHAILLVGIDEDEDKICYVDPATKLKNLTDNHYQWISIINLRKAMKVQKLKNNFYRYSIEIFKKDNIPLSKKQIFENAHNRNIKRMKGFMNFYDKKYKYNKFGFNALKLLKNNLEKEFMNPIPLRFKLICLRYFLVYKISNFFNFRSSNNELKYFNPFGELTIEKHNTIKYLMKNIRVYKMYQQEINLLKEELENWDLLITYFSKFIEKNVFLKTFYAQQLLNKIILLIDKIILIEEKITSLQNKSA